MVWQSGPKEHGAGESQLFSGVEETIIWVLDIALSESFYLAGWKIKK